MRVFILVALLFVFTAGSHANMAHASVGDHICAHHHINQDNSADNEPCHSEQNQNQCDDCCCVHSHSLTTPVISTKIPVTKKQRNIIVSIGNYYSTEISGLKRPPRL